MTAGKDYGDGAQLLLQAEGDPLQGGGGPVEGAAAHAGHSIGTQQSLGLGKSNARELGSPSFFLNFILGLLSIVTMNIRNINWGYNALLRFFSGQMVPLWIFPSVLGIISDFLPFRCIYAIPMSIYIGNYAGMDMLMALAVQFTWIFVLWLTSRLLMKRVFARVMIQGG